MIQYSLKCAEGHRFDSWFQSASAFDTLARSGHLSCAVCGTAQVEKAIMAPRVSTAESKPAPQEAPPAAEGALSAPRSEAEQALAALRKHVEANSDYVGKDFAAQARAMHLGEAEHRPIWGEARGDEAKALIDDGVPVAPLPFVPSRKTN